MNLVPILAWVGKNGALPSWVRPVAVRIIGFDQVLTTSGTVAAFLDLPDVTVPYGDRSSLLGLGAFPLALDGEPHLSARDLIEDVIRTTDDAHKAGVAAAATVAGQRVAVAAGGQLDVAGGVVEPALIAWVERWFGLPGLGTSLLRSGRLIMHATFLNPTRPNGRVDTAGLQRAVDWVNEQRPQLAVAIDGAAAGTVAAALRERTGDAGLAAGHLLALTVGPLALGAWALDVVIDDLLDRPSGLDYLKTDEDGQMAFSSALRRRAPLLGVKRDTPSGRQLEGTRSRIDLPPGHLLAATACADRSPGPNLFAFGSGRHSCLGPRQMSEVAGPILRILGSASPRRDGRLLPDAKPSGVRTWPFPGRLVVQLLR